MLIQITVDFPSTTIAKKGRDVTLIERTSIANFKPGPTLALGSILKCSSSEEKDRTKFWGRD